MLFKVLADPTRLDILRFLSSDEKCVSDIMKAFTLPQPLASHHLKVLREACLVASKKVGQKVFYSIHPDAHASVNDKGETFLNLSCCAIQFHPKSIDS